MVNGIEDNEEFKMSEGAHSIMVHTTEDFWGLQFENIHQAYAVFCFLNFLCVGYYGDELEWHYRVALDGIISCSEEQVIDYYQEAYNYDFRRFVKCA